MMRNNLWRARIAIIALRLSIFALVLLALIFGLQLFYPSVFLDRTYMPNEFTPLALIAKASSYLIFLVSSLFTGIAFILWFTRAYRNLRVLLPHSMLKYPYWVAALAWFVPFFNLVAPYKIATDLFDKTERYLLREGSMELRPTYDIIKGWWWATWIASTLLIVLSERYQRIEMLSYFGPIAHIIGFITAIVSAIFAIKMIKNYSEMEELIKQLETGNTGFHLKDGDLLD